jgi:hypothetical protein
VHHLLNIHFDAFVQAGGKLSQNQHLGTLNNNELLKIFWSLSRQASYSLLNFEKIATCLTKRLIPEKKLFQKIDPVE